MSDEIEKLVVPLVADARPLLKGFEEGVAGSKRFADDVMKQIERIGSAKVDGPDFNSPKGSGSTGGSAGPSLQPLVEMARRFTTGLQSTSGKMVASLDRLGARLDAGIKVPSLDHYLGQLQKAARGSLAEVHPPTVNRIDDFKWMGDVRAKFWGGGYKLRNTDGGSLGDSPAKAHDAPPAGLGEGVDALGRFTKALDEAAARLAGLAPGKSGKAKGEPGVEAVPGSGRDAYGRFVPGHKNPMPARGPGGRFIAPPPVVPGRIDNLLAGLGQAAVKLKGPLDRLDKLKISADPFNPLPKAKPAPTTQAEKDRQRALDARRLDREAGLATLRANQFAAPSPTKKAPAGPVGGLGKAAAEITGVAPAARAASTAVASTKFEVLGLVAASTGIASIGGFFVAGIRGAIDLRETLSKVDVVFGPQAKGVVANADAMAKAFGLPRGPILDATAAIGLLGKGAGQSQAQAASMGVDMAKLAADCASFYHVPLPEALNKIRAGLAGESEPLRGFGVQLSETEIATRAVSLGLAKTTKEVDEGAKVTARASLITEKLADASGDLDRTQGSTANQLARFTGGITNTATSLGRYLLPAVDKVIAGFNWAQTSVSTFIDSNKALFTGIGEWISGAVGTVGEGVSAIMGAVGNLPAAWTAAFGEGPRDLVKNIGESFLAIADAIAVGWRNLPAVVEIGVLKMGGYMEVLPKNLKILGDWIAKDWRNIILDQLAEFGTTFQNLAKNIWNFSKAITDFATDPMKGFKFEWTSIFDGLGPAAARMPEMIKPGLGAVQAQIDAKMAEIGKAEAARTARLAQEAKARADAEAAGSAQQLKKVEAQARADVNKPLADYVAKLQERLKTPLEKYREEIGKLDQARKAGLIDQETYDRGKVAAAVPLEKRSNAEAVNYGSKEAYSTIIRANAAGRGGTGIESLAKKQDEGNTINREAANYLRQMAAGMGWGTQNLKVASL